MKLSAQNQGHRMSKNAAPSSDTSPRLFGDRGGPAAMAAPRWIMRLWAVAAILVALAFAVFAPPAAAKSRIKDLVEIEGVRENALIGYGLVVGLDGTGDRLQNAPFTRQSLQAMLERLGVNTRLEDLLTENVAAVMVTGTLHAFATQGARIDVAVSALGDADSLLGGTLLATPLIGADGEIYAVAQGPIAVGGFAAGGDAAEITRGVPTSGRIANGATIEREVAFQLKDMRDVKLALRNPDFTTASRIADAVNAFLGGGAARATDPSSVRIDPPGSYQQNLVALITDVEQLLVEPDQPARVVIDEASGVIVMGKEVRVSTVAIAQGSLTVSVSEAPQVSQPNAFAENGETVVVPRTEVEVDDSGGAKLAVVEEGVRLQDLVDGLNALGVGPRDMISILQSIKAAGALQADIDVM